MISGRGCTMVGDKIKKLRKEKKLTLKDVAEATGLSIGYISQLERGVVEPSLASLRKVCEFFGVSPYLLAEQLEHYPGMVRNDQRPIIKFPKSEIYYEIVSPMSAPEYTPSSMVVQFQIEPGGHDSEEFLTHTSEEIVVLLQGEIDMLLGETCYHLNAGDSLVVRPNMPHRTINTGEIPAIGFCVMTPMWMN